MKSNLPVQRRPLLIAGILTLLFLLITKLIPLYLTSRNIIYDPEVIGIKAGKMSSLLTWPLSELFADHFVNSYYFIPIVFIFYWILVIVLKQVHLFLKERKIYRWIFASVLLFFILLRIFPNTLCWLDDQQPSRSIGTSGKGSLEHGKRLLFYGNNFRYFNFLSYLKGNCFVHHKVKQTLIDTYKTCETTCPGILFYTGEGSMRKGGPYIVNHRTHQNGLSVDLLLNYKKDNKTYDPVGLFNAYGYGLNTDDQGKLNKSMPVDVYNEDVQLDFETNARFLLALDDACRKNGIRIRIVILKTALKPSLFATPSGKKILERKIRFAHTLTPMLNQAHDDHFHVDFEL
jgi:penicillin-insensitive murein endopeptidase